MRHIFLRRERSYLANKLGGNRAPPCPTLKKLNCKVPNLLSKLPSDPAKKVLSARISKSKILIFHKRSFKFGKNSIHASQDNPKVI